jgi:hypothetical protein
MKWLIVFLFFLILISPVLAETTNNTVDIAKIEDRINSIAHYAEEYEIGNINYFQLNVYGFEIKSELNLLMGGGIGEEWARIPKENVEKAFGTPTEYMNWIWIDNKHVQKRFDEAMPRWERIVFDGRKIQVIFQAFPSAIEKENGELFKYYSVDLNVRFKKELEVDINSILDDLITLIADYNLTRTRKSGEIVVKKMVEYQRLLNRYTSENSEQCMDILEGFFKPENKWPPQKIMSWTFSLYNGTNFDVTMRIDMCEECIWHFLYMDVMVEGRGPAYIFKSPELQFGKLEHKVDEEYFWTLSADEVNQELKKAIFEIRDDAEKFDKTRSEDFPKKFFFNRFKIQQINRILDGKYNGVENFDSGIARRIESGELQGPDGCKNLNECRKYCEKQENIDECRKFTYNLRVGSVEKMFTGYNIQKILMNEIYWDWWFFENSEIQQDSWCRYTNDLQCKEDEGCVNGECVPALGGNETCNNKEDDDADALIDCQDPGCWKERRCGKLCEKVCNKEGGCWQTSHKLCSGVCKECWECGGDENCKSLCEPECWPCNNQQDVKKACDDCWICEDEAYGGCYAKCKTCEECNTQRKDKISAIFARAAAGEIKTPGGCMTEEECNKYCSEHGEECREIINQIGLNSEELDCSGECKECTICNYDLGNFKCNHKQHFDKTNGFCVCDEEWFDCDGNWNNGCESNKPCDAGPCFEKCEECDACKEGEEKCKDLCLDCHKCRNPDMPTYTCNGVEQLEPCETEYICNGVKQKKPCEIYRCKGREYTKPCDEINITCGKNQILIEDECVCEEGFKDCNDDGDCESTKFCGLEICDDGKDDNNDGLVDCQDQKCDRQVCGTENGKRLLCINTMCIPPEEEIIPVEPEPICGNHICEKKESVETCPEDCFVCESHEPPECPNGKIVWKGKDNLGCLLPPICVVTEKTCENNNDCPQPKCGVSQCVNGECKITELLTECEEGCKEGKTKKRECKDGSEIITAVCSANQWVETGYDCAEIPIPPTAQPEEEKPKEKVPEIPEEIAPEVEEEAPEACDECTLANDCGGPQDVCSNGNCVTLPIPVEKEVEKKAPGGPPEAPPGKSSEVQEKSKESEVPTEQPQESPPTGSMISNFVNFVTGWFTGFFEAETQPCNEECKPCEECNQALDNFMKRIDSGEILGPNGCKNRAECNDYCNRDENKGECENFFKGLGLKTFYCWWEFCRECDKCRFNIGEFECKANQHFNIDEGFCECNEGWQDCDGDWETGCESSQQCKGCQSKEDCAEDRCAPWGNVIQQFDCFKGEERLQVKGVVRLEGRYRVLPTEKINCWAGFDMWGEPFESLYPIKEEVEREVGWEWCEWDLENNIKERIEIQNSLTEDFLKWFFEEYVPSSPSEWEKHIGGIYDSYWRIVNNDEWTVQNLLCLGRDKLPEEYKPIDISYSTEFGSVRIWEVEKTTDFFGKRTKILSPYMQIWVFPPKEFIKKEFQNAMKTGTMPGPEGEKPELSLSEIEEAKKDKNLMEMINSMSSKYGGEAKFLFNIMDGNELVFNALITINPEILMKVEPMKTYEGDYDAKITFDFDFFYSLVGTTAKEIGGTQTQYPPWEEEELKIGDMIKGVVDGVKMWFMITSASASGKIRAEPSEALPDGLNLLRLLFKRGSS